MDQDTCRDKKPNIVFILTDDQGYGDLGCTGNHVIQTPNIDKLYHQSIRFSNYHVGPTCAPTRAGLLTGHYHNSTGVWHTIGGRSLLRKNEVSLAQVLKNNGYKTGIFGKWHLGDNYPYRPHDRGFDEAVIHGGGGIGQTPDYWGNDYFDDTYFDKGQPKGFKGYCTDIWFNLGLDFIQRNKDEPFFCFIPTNAPHSPLHVSEQYSSLYQGQVKDDRARFYGMISNIDENVGILREKLREWQLDEDTLLIFMTDNGTADGCDLDPQGFVTDGYNARMRGKKGSPYDGGHRVPFFLHWVRRGWNKGKDINRLTANVDVMPTLIALCDLDVPDHLQFDGVSLVPLMEGKDQSWEERTLVTDSQRLPDPVKWKDSAVMTEQWRLINGTELYRIQEDAEQRKDVALLYPEIVESMRQDYMTWWEKVSRQFDEEIPISIGSEREKITDLTSHDWRGDSGDCAWNQGDIRAGKICNSHWELFVEEDGVYCFELRRWPEEQGNHLREGIPGELKGWYSGGRAIPIKKASIRIRDFEETKNIKQNDQFIAFTVTLKKGPAHLQTYLEDKYGSILGAYYVYVSRNQHQ